MLDVARGKKEGKGGRKEGGREGRKGREGKGRKGREGTHPNSIFFQHPYIALI